MSAIGPLFDAAEGERLRDEGIDRARYSLSGWDASYLEAAKEEAIRIANLKGTVNADEVVESFSFAGIDLPSKIGNAMGSIFRGGGWKVVGYVNSERTSNHARVLRVWARK